MPIINIEEFAPHYGKRPFLISRTEMFKLLFAVTIDEENGGTQRNEVSEENAELIGNTNSKRLYSLASSNSMAKVQLLENQFLLLVEKLKEITDSVSGNNSKHKTTLLYAKNQLAQICGDIDKFQFEKIDSISTGDLESGHSVVKTRRKSLNKRCDLLRSTALSTVSAIEGLLEGSSDSLAQATLASSASFGAVCVSTAVDSLYPDWAHVMALQNKRYLQSFQIYSFIL